MIAKVVFVLVCLALCGKVCAEDEEKGKNTPEIVYIHYSTPEEADYARKQILAQYEALGGSATIVHENVPDLPLINDEKESVNSTEKSDESEIKKDS